MDCITYWCLQYHWLWCWRQTQWSLQISSLFLFRSDTLRFRVSIQNLEASRFHPKVGSLPQHSSKHHTFDNIFHIWFIHWIAIMRGYIRRELHFLVICNDKLEPTKRVVYVFRSTCYYSLRSRFRRLLMASFDFSCLVFRENIIHTLLDTFTFYRMGHGKYSSCVDWKCHWGWYV